MNIALSLKLSSAADVDQQRALNAGGGQVVIRLATSGDVRGREL